MQSCNPDNNETCVSEECNPFLIHTHIDVYIDSDLPRPIIVTKPGKINCYVQKHQKDEKEISSLLSAPSQHKF